MDLKAEFEKIKQIAKDNSRVILTVIVVSLVLALVAVGS